MVLDMHATGMLNPMAATWTKAAKVRRTFKAGRALRKDRILSPTMAIHEACILQERLRAAMVEAELPVEDVRTALVLMVPNYVPERDAVHVLRIPEPANLPGLFRRVEEIDETGRVQTLGLGVWQKDREIGNAVGWIQPFLIGARAGNGMTKARKILMDSEGGESRFERAIEREKLDAPTAWSRRATDRIPGVSSMDDQVPGNPQGGAETLI